MSDRTKVCQLITHHKRLTSSLNRDITDVELWDKEIEERERQEREKDQSVEEDDLDTAESQTEPGNGLTWDKMIFKDHGVQPAWVEKQERELLERSLPWRQDPKGTWFRDPSPRWRILPIADYCQVVYYSMLTDKQDQILELKVAKSGIENHSRTWCSVLYADMREKAGVTTLRKMRIEAKDNFLLLVNARE